MASSSSSHALPTPQALPNSAGGDSQQGGIGSGTVVRYGNPPNQDPQAPLDLLTQNAQGTQEVSTLVVERRITEMAIAKVPRINSPNKVQLQMELANCNSA